ncbi:MAG: DUF177 domain-containing protein [Syntrophales bacterium]
MKININNIPEDGLDIQATKDRNWLQTIFGDVGESDFALDEIHITCNIRKLQQSVFLNGTIETVIRLACSRCLETALLPVSTPFRYTLVPAKAEESREEIELSEEDLEYGYYEGETVDCDPLIYEQIVLQIPIKVLCMEDCRGLCPGCGTNLNLGACNCPSDRVDERLAVLKKLKLTS